MTYNWYFGIGEDPQCSVTGETVSYCASDPNRYCWDSQSDCNEYLPNAELKCIQGDDYNECPLSTPSQRGGKKTCTPASSSLSNASETTTNVCVDGYACKKLEKTYSKYFFDIPTQSYTSVCNTTGDTISYCTSTPDRYCWDSKSSQNENIDQHNKCVDDGYETCPIVNS